MMKGGIGKITIPEVLRGGKVQILVQGEEHDKY